jgi:hypothetical protein
MAKRSKRKQEQFDLLQHPGLVRKIVWGVIIGVALLFGISNGYPIVAQGQVMAGIIKGLAYGGGALAILALALYVNRKLKGF